MMFRKGFLYLLLSYFIQFLNIILNLYLMKYLNPHQLGSLSIARVWQQLVDYSHFGTRFSLDRYVPTVEESEKKQLVSTVLITTIINSLLVCFLAVILSAADVIVSILTISGFFISIVNIFKAYYRAVNNIDKMVKIVFYNQIIPLIFSLLIYLQSKDFNWYLISLLSSYIFTFIILIFNEKELYRHFNLQNFKVILSKITKPSLWLFLNSLFVFAYLVMDRFFIDYTLGREALGDYSIIVFAFSALMILPATMAELLFVKIIKQSFELGKMFFLKEILVMLFVTSIGVIIANVAMSYFIQRFTNYNYLIDEIKLMTWAVIPFGLTAIYSHVLNGLDLRKKLTLANLVVLLILLIYYIYLLLFNKNISLDYYVYAKVSTGWIVFINYIIVILSKKKCVDLNAARY